MKESPACLWTVPWYHLKKKNKTYTSLLCSKRKQSREEWGRNHVKGHWTQNLETEMSAFKQDDFERGICWGFYMVFWYSHPLWSINRHNRNHLDGGWGWVRRSTCRLRRTEKAWFHSVKPQAQIIATGFDIHGWLGTLHTLGSNIVGMESDIYRRSWSSNTGVVQRL